MGRRRFFPSLKWANALFNCGLPIFHGLDVSINCLEAAKYFKLAADQNRAVAQNHSVHCLQDGIDVPINISEGARYLKLAADQNDVVAQTSYSCCLQQGIRVPMNKSEAARYFKLAADQHDAMGNIFMTLRF
jgi:TPR repeat protein